MDRPPICDYENSDYQQVFWDTGEREYEDRAEAVALKRLLDDSGKLLLEVGAGAGRNSPRYQGYEQVVLLDYSLTQLQQARQRLGGNGRYHYVAANAYRLPFVTGLFDAATMIRTLHHMAQPRSVLQEVRRVLEPRGIFILEYANKQNLKAIARYALRRQSWSPFTLEPVEFVRLNFDFHPRAVRNWLQVFWWRSMRWPNKPETGGSYPLQSLRAPAPPAIRPSPGKMPFSAARNAAQLIWTKGKTHSSAVPAGGVTPFRKAFTIFESQSRAERRLALGACFRLFHHPEVG
jgi:SAM-dependent methyltransferase